MVLMVMIMVMVGMVMKQYCEERDSSTIVVDLQFVAARLALTKNLESSSKCVYLIQIKNQAKLQDPKLRRELKC